MPLTWEAEACGAVLWLGKSAVLSHGAAARLWGWSNFGLAGVEVTSLRRCRAPEGITLHIGSLVPVEIVKSGCLRYTSPARTLLDIASTSSSFTVESSLDEALARRQVTLTRLEFLLAKESKKKTSGVLLLKELIRSRDPRCRPPASELERLVLRTIRRSGLPLPQTQRAIFDNDRQIARVDFAYPEHGVVIEADSFRHHSTLSDWAVDVERESDLVVQGLRVLRVTWQGVTRHPDRFIERLRRVLVAAGAILT